MYVWKPCLKAEHCFIFFLYVAESGALWKPYASQGVKENEPRERE
jgi:hypothetical protein